MGARGKILGGKRGMGPFPMGLSLKTSSTGKNEPGTSGKSSLFFGNDSLEKAHPWWRRTRRDLGLELSVVGICAGRGSGGETGARDLGKLLNNEWIRSSQIPVLPPDPGADGIWVGFPTPADPGAAAPSWNEEFIWQIPKKSCFGSDVILGIAAGIAWRDPRAFVAFPVFRSRCFVPGVQQHWEMGFSMDFRSSSGRSGQNPSPASG